MRALALVLVPSLAAVTVSACQSANTTGNTAAECRPLTGAAPARPAAWRGTVFTIVMENHDRGQIIGNAQAPYITGLARDYAEAAGYHDSFVHPSEPNYIWMVAGENFGILNDDDPGPGNAIASRSHLVDQIEQAGLTWKAYQEGMGQPCGLRSHDRYAAKHNPFVYFDDVSGWDGKGFAPSARCAEHVVDYSQLAADIAAGQLPDYVFITPDMVDDMHDGSIQDGDRWLAAEVPKLLATDAFQRGGVLFLLWDEGASGGDDPPFIAVSPHARRGFVSTTDYDTSAYLKTVQAILGLEPLPCGTQPDTVPLMEDLFTEPLR